MRLALLALACVLLMGCEEKKSYDFDDPEPRPTQTATQ